MPLITEDEAIRQLQSATGGAPGPRQMTGVATPDPFAPKPKPMLETTLEAAVFFAAIFSCLFLFVKLAPLLREKQLLYRGLVRARIERSELDGINSFAADSSANPDAPIGRPEAVRRIIRDWLIAHGYLPQ